MKIRGLRDSDLAEVLAIQTQCPQAAQWRGEDYQRLAADPAGIVLVAEVGAAPVGEPSDNGNVTGARLAITMAGSVGGFVAFRRTGTEGELQNLGVVPSYRRRGAARRLVEAGQLRLRAARVERVYLEVRASNVPALSLYSSMGYRIVSVRPKYYQDPEDDAKVLCLVLSTPILS